MIEQPHAFVRALQQVPSQPGRVLRALAATLVFAIAFSFTYRVLAGPRSDTEHPLPCGWNLCVTCQCGNAVGDAWTVGRRALGDVLDEWERSDRRTRVRELLLERDGIDPDEVILTPERASAMGMTSTVCFPLGNLAPQGSVVKSTASAAELIDGDGVYRHTGPARCIPISLPIRRSPTARACGRRCSHSRAAVGRRRVRPRRHRACGAGAGDGLTRRRA